MNIKKIFYSEKKYFEGPFVYKPDVFYDKRGFFLESCNIKTLKENIAPLCSINPEEFNFVQENHSFSKKGVLRGLHYQESPFSQGKLVRCVAGEVFDVIVDIRINSPSFGKWAGINLSARNFNQLWVPIGFAHGFLAIEDQTELFYKTTNYWKKDHEKVLDGMTLLLTLNGQL